MFYRGEIVYRIKFLSPIVALILIYAVGNAVHAQTGTGQEPTPVMPINVPLYRILFEYNQDLNSPADIQNAITLETQAGVSCPYRLDH